MDIEMIYTQFIFFRKEAYMAQVYFEDVKVGDQIPSFAKQATLMELNRFAGSNDEFVLIHMDREYSVSVGLPDVIVMGNLKCAYLSRMLMSWIGEEGTLRKIASSYRGMDIPSDTMVCKGIVTDKYTKDGVNYVVCDIWAENERVGKTTPGSAIVTLPSRK